jgi:hypothetical protein
MNNHNLCYTITKCYLTSGIVGVSMSENTISDIPQGQQGVAVENTELVLPDLPGEWEWRTVNRAGNDKVNVFFGKDSGEVGGWLGEIDNYVKRQEGEKVQLWDVHVREIIGLQNGDNRPSATANTCTTFTSLHEAIQAVPREINQHYK